MVVIVVVTEEMEAFSERSIDTYFEFSKLQFFIVLFFSTLVGVTFGAIFYWPVGLGVGGGLFCLLYIILGKCRPFNSVVYYHTLLYDADFLLALWLLETTRSPTATATYFFSATDLYPSRATEPKCKLMLAKSPESAHKKYGAVFFELSHKR